MVLVGIFALHVASALNGMRNRQVPSRYAFWQRRHALSRSPVLSTWVLSSMGNEDYMPTSYFFFEVFRSVTALEYSDWIHVCHAISACRNTHSKPLQRKSRNTTSYVSSCHTDFLCNEDNEARWIRSFKPRSSSSCCHTLCV